MSGENMRGENKFSPLPKGEGPGVRAAGGGRRHVNPYVQVALTYLRRPFSSWKIGLIFVGVVLPAVLSIFLLGRIRNHQVFTLPLLLPFAFLFLFLVAHVKDQFADSRARLTPAFRRVHATIAAAAAVVCAVCLPAVFAWLVGWHSIGSVAVAVCLLGTILWMLLLLSGWLNVLLLLGWFSICAAPAGRGCLTHLLSGDFEPQAAVLLALGAVVTLLGGIRLFQLNEDMPDYRWIKWNRTMWEVEVIGPKGAEAPIARRLKDWFTKRQMARLSRHVQCAARSPWSRILRWQAGMPSGLQLWFFALLAIAYLQFLAWYLPQPNNTPMLVGNSLVMFPVMFAAVLFLGWLTMRTRTTWFELTLPVDRRAYVRQTGAALALGYFKLWGVIVATTVLWWLTLAPQTPPPAYLGSAAAVSLLGQIWLFGVMVFVWSITKSYAPLVIAFAISFFVMVLIIMRGCGDQNSQVTPETIPLTAALAAIGLLLSYVAYRRCLSADVD